VQLASNCVFSSATVPAFLFLFPSSTTFSAKRNAFLHWKRTPYDCGEKNRKETERKRKIMKNSNQINIPQAREAMDKFKMQAAQEMGVNLKQGYNGDLTSREAGSVGGQMVKNMCPMRSMKFERENRVTMGHRVEIEYMVGLTI